VGRTGGQTDRHNHVKPLSDSALKLPRLLYLGDVPVEASYHGSALLYRLLQHYPPERLRIIEGNLRTSKAERRLTGVNYRTVKVGWARPLYTRFNRWVTLAYSFAARLRASAVRKARGGFQPEAILSVTHEFLWLTAARFARSTALPLHLICHDDWPNVAAVPPRFRPWLDREFACAYRQAASRLCVSPFMAEEYQRRYGVSGTVLYPSRAADAPQFAAPPDRLLKRNGQLTMAFAGTINSRGYVWALQNLAGILESMRGRLLIFGPVQERDAAASGLNGGNIELRGTVSSAELIKRLREEAHVLFVPMSFDPMDAPNMKMGFPSKLTDCTAVGLPLLVYGPTYCSAVRWARENPGVAEVVDCEDAATLASAVHRLMGDPQYRVCLARCALETGNRYFSHAAAHGALLRGLAHP
jgi:hypothetical protein